MTVMGRPYPLYVMGAGPLTGYPKRWDLLPFAFENLWSQMEYLCNKRYIDFSQLEADVQRLPTPENRWPMFEADRKNRWDSWCSQTPPDHEKIRKVLRRHTGTPQFLVPLIEDTSPDTVSTMGLWLSILKTEEKAMFGTAFFGGNVSKPCLAVFRRPLGTEDFVQPVVRYRKPYRKFLIRKQSDCRGNYETPFDRDVICSSVAPNVKLDAELVLIGIDVVSFPFSVIIYDDGFDPTADSHRLSFHAHRSFRNLIFTNIVCPTLLFGLIDPMSVIDCLPKCGHKVEVIHCINSRFIHSLYSCNDKPPTLSKNELRQRVIFFVVAGRLEFLDSYFM